MVRPKLNDARVEVVTGVAEATTLLWELLRDDVVRVTLQLARCEQLLTKRQNGTLCMKR